MTVIALRGRHQVICRLVADMTLVASTRCNACVIEHGGRPGIGCVAVVTGITAADVHRAFALRDCVVVTTAASTYNLKVINLQRRFPCRGAMTVLADIGGIEMSRLLIRQMTTRAPAGDRRMVKHRW